MRDHSGLLTHHVGVELQRPRIALNGGWDVGLLDIGAGHVIVRVREVGLQPYGRLQGTDRGSSHVTLRTLTGRLAN